MKWHICMIEPEIFLRWYLLHLDCFITSPFVVAVGRTPVYAVISAYG